MALTPTVQACTLARWIRLPAARLEPSLPRTGASSGGISCPVFQQRLPAPCGCTSRRRRDGEHCMSSACACAGAVSRSAAPTCTIARLARCGERSAPARPATHRSPARAGPPTRPPPQPPPPLFRALVAHSVHPVDDRPLRGTIGWWRGCCWRCRRWSPGSLLSLARSVSCEAVPRTVLLFIRHHAHNRVPCGRAVCVWVRAAESDGGGAKPEPIRAVGSHRGVLAKGDGHLPGLQGHAGTSSCTFRELRTPRPTQQGLRSIRSLSMLPTPPLRVHF